MGSPKARPSSSPSAVLPSDPDGEDMDQRRAEVEKYIRLYSQPIPDGKPYGQMPRFRGDLIETEFFRMRRGGAETLLEIGCGRGWSIDKAKQLGFRVQGVEVVPQLCNEDVRLIEGAHDLPFPDGSFDAVTAFDVLEHILPRDIDSVLGEIYRVMCGEGAFVVASYASHWGGMNLHPTLEPVGWWFDCFRKLDWEVSCEPVARKKATNLFRVRK